MRKTFLLLLAGLLAIASAYGRQKVEEKRGVAPFSVINVVDNIDVVYEQGPSYSVRLTGSAEALEQVDVSVNGKSLNIRTKDYAPNGFGGVYIEMSKAKPANVTVYVTAPDVKAFNQAGSGRVRVDKMSTQSVSFNLAGSGRVEVGQLSGDKASFNLAGSGNMSLGDMSVKKLNLSLSGSGHVEAHASGATSLACNAIGTGSIDVSGTVDTYSRVTIGGATINDGSLKYATMTNSTTTNSSVYYDDYGSGSARHGDSPRSVDGIVVNP